MLHTYLQYSCRCKYVYPCTVCIPNPDHFLFGGIGKGSGDDWLPEYVCPGKDSQNHVEIKDRARCVGLADGNYTPPAGSQPA